MKKSTAKHRQQRGKGDKTGGASPRSSAHVSSDPLYWRVIKIIDASIFARVCDQTGQILDMKGESVAFPRQAVPTVFLGDILCARDDGTVSPVPLHRRRFLQVVVIRCLAEYAEVTIDERGSSVLAHLLGCLSAETGAVYYAEVLSYPTETMPAILTVCAPVTCTIADAPYEERMVCDQFALPLGFDRAVMRACDADLRREPAGDCSVDEAYHDLTQCGFVTIDGETSKDFDDAVYAEAGQRGDKRLLVAIADVSRYVQAGSLLDQDAQQRGNSVYLPGMTLPMLPEALSNDLCSLKPHQKRYTLVCDMTIGVRGGVKAYSFYPAVIRSVARLTYDEALMRLSAGADDEITARLEALYQVYLILRKHRHRRGAIDFDLPELRVTCGTDGAFLGLKPALRHDMHRLIEECMLAANVCAAIFLEAQGKQHVYRIHEAPDVEKIDVMRKSLSMHGVVVPKHFGGTVGDYTALLDQMADNRELQIFVLRSLKQAAYAQDNVGHFGLHYERYTHFTSPIRRYPDLLVHRLIKEAIGVGSFDVYTKHQWTCLLTHLSLTERIAEDVSRGLMAWYKCLSMYNHVGAVLTGRISGVTHFGIFVTIDDMGIEGVVHISRLGQDYFYFDPKKMILCGRRYHKIYRIGDILSVEVAQVNLRTRRIDLTLLDASQDEKR